MHQTLSMGGGGSFGDLRGNANDFDDIERAALIDTLLQAPALNNRHHQVRQPRVFIDHLNRYHVRMHHRGSTLGFA